MSVKLISITPDAERIIAYCARVSNPANQENTEVEGLLRYCIKHGHWSVFEMANMCLEIHTSRDISAQIVRHRSFSFQEFSQRYAKVVEIVPTRPRKQDLKNRQNSTDDLDENTRDWWEVAAAHLSRLSLSLYEKALEKGIAKESARRILPMSTGTTLYMNGNIRSWMHYFDLRCDDATQREHRDIARQAKAIFKEQLPIIGAIYG